MIKFFGRDKTVFCVKGVWLFPLGFSIILFLGGCAPPSVRPSRTTILHPDQEDDIGGSFLESSDIRTIASQVTPSLLSVPEIAKEKDIVRIAMAPTRNSTRYVIDRNIVARRLRLELNDFSEGRVRFFSQELGQEVRKEILEQQQEQLWDFLIEEATSDLLSSRIFTSESKQPLNLAVIPVKNTNLVGVNADSFTALIRAKAVEKSQGRFVFLSREHSGKVIDQVLDEKDVKNQGLVSQAKEEQLSGVDYFLTGEFVAKSMVSEGASASVEMISGASPDDPRVIEGKVVQAQRAPNVTKYLNVQLVNAETGAVVFERLIEVDTRITSGVERADYILTSELSALSKASQRGERSDYILMTFQLVDPISNEILWEKGYETKRKTSTSVIYR